MRCDGHPDLLPGRQRSPALRGDGRRRPGADLRRGRGNRSGGRLDAAKRWQNRRMSGISKRQRRIGTDERRQGREATHDRTAAGAAAALIVPQAGFGLERDRRRCPPFDLDLDLVERSRLPRPGQERREDLQEPPARSALPQAGRQGSEAARRRPLGGLGALGGTGRHPQVGRLLREGQAEGPDGLRRGELGDRSSSTSPRPPPDVAAP